MAWAFLTTFILTALPTSFALTTDGHALIAFKNSVSGDPLGTLATWNPKDDTPCHWHGIVCNTLPGFTTPRVVSISVVMANISGRIPPEMGTLDQLRRLSLHHNSLTGTLPQQLFNATALRSIFVQGNLISGEIPSQISLLPYLQNLDLSHNQLFGMIPDSIAECRQLQILGLANNFLSGYIPDGIGDYLTALQELDLSDNNLSGPIPRNFGNLSSLQSTLNLSYNRLSGSIPESLGKLPYTVSLDFSHNNLSGRIPQEGSLADQGPGPFIGNPALCGLPLSRPCPVAPYVPPLPSMPRDGAPPVVGPFGAEMPRANLTRRASLSTGAIIAIAVGDAVGISLVGIILVYFYWKTSICDDKCCRKKGSSEGCCVLGGGATTSGGASEESEGSSDTKTAEQGELVALDKGFSYELDELLRASAYVLGKGGLGIVYKVVLGSGVPMAVRRLGEGGVQRFKEFESEVQAIAKVRHPNVVRLRAYYWADDEKLLIYDYIANGSVAAALHGTSQSPSRALTWTERFKIAKGAAVGLAFIHECSPRKYVHGDIKASKILLDMHMEAHIADFGLARLASIAGGATHDRHPSMGAIGIGASSSSIMTLPSGSTTLGASSATTTWHARAQSSSSALYRAPECHLEGKPAQKWDVYAYGVVLMELLTGRSPAFQLATYGEELVTWLGRVLTKEEKVPTQILDPTLLLDSSHVQKQMMETLHLAITCTSHSPDHRPKMRGVVDALDKISPPYSP
ncbi:hypothetical protein GOP47_0026757 [Adiantum capillus-veneris]|nr:hypothetical protein GOP47_0026757 [Adiantum capillus-veneris]